MKKLLLVLLIVALAAFLLAGCNPVTPPVEGEGEPQVGVPVVISDAVVVDGKTYVSAGDHTITVTFPAPVAGVVTATITDCTGDYSKAIDAVGTSVVLFPDATKKIWTGSGTFAASDTECCASYVEVTSGECTELVCIALPVIVDGEPPEATVEVCLADCTCAGCEIVFSSHISTALCAPDEVICGDDCSGLASWSIDIFDRYPFDECCETPCYEPIESESGICPIDFTTTCLTDLKPGIDTVYAVVTLVDNVGNDRRFGATITFNPDICDYINFEEWPAGKCVDTPDFVYCDDADVYHPADDADVDHPAVDHPALGPEPVDLGSAGLAGSNFVILAKTGISTTGTTSIVGDIGVSPAAASLITGFGLIMDSTNVFSTSSLVTGKVYAADYYPPTPANMTTAISAMEAAYTDAAGRTNPTATELGAGDISGMTLAPGLYKWPTGVLITSAGVTLSGGADDVWIFQIAEDLTVNSGAVVHLSGGAQAKNIFWQVGGQATLGTTSDFKGTILSQTLISMNTGAVLTGRAWAQSAVTLIGNTIITVP